MKVCNHFDLTNYNSYRISAVCKRAYFPEGESDIVKLYKYNNRTRKVLLGNGNNVILSKYYYDEEFIIFNGNYNNVSIENDNIIIAQAGATTKQLSELALRKNLTGLEIFHDIPSSVGGAIVMNAGANGEEIKDLVIKVKYFDLFDKKLKYIYPDDLEFQYRNSYFQKNLDKIVLEVWFKLNPGNHHEIKTKIERVKHQRWDKQPRDYPNCGSVFKRPKGYYVGTMLDELNLKGFTIGDAMISEKHSGFIINKGQATGANIIAIIKEAQRKVKEKFNVDLEIEQRII